jgi:hypothetical protein
MNWDNKDLLDFLIDQTKNDYEKLEKRFNDHAEEVNQKIDRLGRYGVMAVLLCVALSPASSKLLELLPHLLEVLSYASGAK